MGSRFWSYTSRVLVAVFALAVFGGLTKPADAFQVKRVIRNTTAFQLLNGEEVKTYDLTSLLGGTPLDMTKSFIVVTNRVNTSFNTQSDAFVVIDDPATVLAARRTGTSQVDIEFMIVEFVDGVTVQSGITVVSETALTKNVVLPASADLTKSFALISWRSFNSNNNASHDEKNQYTANLTTSTNLQLQRTEQAGTYLNDVYYQVVTFDKDVTVTKGVVDIDAATDAGETSDNGTAMVATISPALSSVNKAMLFFTIRPAAAVNGVEQQFMTDGYISATNAITFSRFVNTNSVTIVYYLLDFSNEMFVQHARNTTALPNGTATANFNLGTATTLARTLATFSSSGAGAAGNGDLDDLRVTGQLSSVAGPNTQVTVTRSTTTALANVSYMAPEFPPVNVINFDAAGTVWKVGESRQITWKHADDVASNAAAIELSNNGGSSWLPTAITCDEGARTMASDICTWTIPDALGGTSVIGNNLKVRVRDTVLSTRNYDASNAAFEIKGTVTVTVPSNANIVWSVGAVNQTISWTNTGDHTTTKARVKLQTAAGADITTISDCLVNIEANTLDWAAVGDYLGTDRKIRVESCADATNVNDVSDNAFEIRGSVTVTYPNGSETLQTQTAYNITWNKTGTFTPQNEVNIYLSKNSGGAYPTTIITDQAAGAASGSYSWTPAAADVTSFGRIKIEQDQNSIVNDASNADFSVVPSITVTAPNGGQTWLVGQTQNITWTTNGAGLATVKIEYSVNGGAYTTIIENDGTANDGIVTNNGTRAWDIPDALGETVLVRISNPSIGAVNDVSDAAFAIRGQTQVSAPNGGQTWTIAAGFGTTSRIQWNNLGSFIDVNSKVEIRYSTNGGGSYTGNIIISNEPNSGASDFYDWSIPENIIVGTENTTMRIKVIPSDVEAVEDASDANFTIRAGLRMNSPNGGETWLLTAGATQDISWTKSGDISTVNLKFSSNNGSSYPTTIVNNRVATASPYTWTLPTTIVTSQGLAKVEAVGQEATIFDVSDATFTVKGTLTLLVPNGAETWSVSDTARNITWDAVGSGGAMDGNVDLHYSTNSGGAYGGVISTDSVLASAELYNWNPVPAGAQSETAKIRVRLSNDTSVSDASNADFKIKPKLAVAVPNGPEAWIVGNNTDDISWTTSGTVTKVNIHYSKNSGGSYTNPNGATIVSDLINSNAYDNWLIPDAISNAMRIKVESNDVGTTDVFDESNADFKIRGSVTITAPNGGETWIVGTAYNVTWVTTGALSGNVKLYYSVDGGTNYVGDPGTPFATVAVTALSYSWTIPNIAQSSLMRVKAVYETDTAVTDASNANFTVKGSLTITAPNGGEVWDLSSAQNITWTKTGTIGNVDLSLSLDGGTDGYVTSIITGIASTSPYAWTIPAVTPLTIQARVKIAPVTASQAAADTSDANFRLRGSFTLAAPNGTETWVVGSVQNVTWTKIGGMANAKLEYSRDGGSTYPFTIIASTPAGTGSYAWTVDWAAGSADADKVNSSTMRVRISDASDATVQDTSDANFTVKGSLTLTAPNGGENWLVNSSQNITWTRTGRIPTVKLEYSTDAGVNYALPNGDTIIASTSGEALAYAWTIPDKIGAQLRVKITDLSNPAASPDESNANFTIRGSLTITAPNGSEQWGIAGSQNITWTRNGTVTEAVKLVYSTNGGVSYPEPSQVITTTPLASALTYAWTIPDAPTTQARVKIVHTPVTTPTADGDESNANFSIKGTLTIVAPNGAEDWKVAESRNITWTRGGSIANVRLDYSTDGGGTYPGVVVASTLGANLSYAWTIPDLSSTTVRVRIQDVSDATVEDASNANFTIKPTVTLTAPNGGQTWIVNDSQNITWTKTGTVANVKLVYSTDGGATYPEASPDNTIVASTPGANLTYAWTIPDKIGTQLRVKIVKSDDASVVDTSDANFTIKGSVVLTAPNGAETWIVNESRNITWTKTGSIANVRLEYSKNAFTNETQTFTIIASTPGGGSPYAWTVADAIGTNLKVRVSDALDSAVNDVSNAAFTIKGALVLTAPNGGQTWAVGTAQNITWTRTGSITNAKLDYSSDGGGSFANAIIASTDASTGTYAWTIPAGAVLTTQGRVRVQDTADATVYDDSNADFNVVGALVLTAPNGGEIWAYNTSQNITWTRSGNNLANVKLEYSTNGGSTYPNVIIGSTAAAAQSFTWTVPNEHSATVRVKVSDAAAAFTGLVNDTSNANFKIRSSLTLTAPDGGEVWTVGTGQNITWTSSGTVNTVKLEYSTDGGSNYPNLITASAPNTGTYSWTVADAISTSVRVKVTDAEDVDASDTSNGNFKIRGALLLTAPNGNEGWGINIPQNITWTRTGSIANVKLEYSTNGFADELQTAVIIASTPADPAPLDNNGVYAWTIPDAPSTTVKVRVSDQSDSTVLDLSNNNFSIKGSITVTSPNGGELWVVGSDYNITWTKFGAMTNVEIRYSENAGSTWPAGNIIVASTAAAAGTYTWTIPDKIGTQVRVRVTNVSDTSVLDDSNADFSIRGSFTLTSPNGSEAWVVGSSQNITWTKTGTLGNAKLELSTNGGSTYPTTITPLVSASALTYSWTIPDTIGNQTRVQISDTAASNPAVPDASNANFTIKGSLTLNAPNGGEIWFVASTQTITWARIGSIANVKLEYATDGVTYSNTIIASTGAAAGSYSWVIPDAITTTAKVRISDIAATAPADADASNANFTIRGSVTLTSPNGGESWLIGGTQNITWDKTGTIANVKLEYSTNGGTTYPNLIIGSTLADTDPPTGTNNGQYAWTIPDVPTTQARVRVTHTADAAVVDESNANFNIRGSLTLTSPNGSEVWVVGESRSITWTKTGSIANVELRYSIDSGANYPNVIIASTAAVALTYAWTVPDAIASTVRVKITDTGDSAVNDASNADFKIKGAVTLTAPNGAEVWIVGASQNITWTKVGSFANVKLEYSTNGFFDELQTVLISASAPAAPLSYAWTVPDAIGTSLKVRVSDAADAANVSDVSNANFTIKGSLTLNAPNGGETWIVGASQNITWSKTGTLGNCTLDYSTNSGSTYPNVIINPVAGSALTYAWTIPDAISAAVRVKLTLLSDTTVNDGSNADFNIKGSLTLTAPNGAETWIVGATQNITWTKTGSIATVRLDYSTNGGVSYPNVITTSYSAGGSPFLWTVPDNMSSTVKVRIQNTADALVEDASNADFKIAGSFTLTSPNGAEKWPAGSSQVITWTKTGSIVNAKLEYSIDGGSTFPNLIVATTPAVNLSYAWVLGSTTSTAVRVRITDVSDSTVNDASNANFKIMGGFTISAPNSGEVWVVGASQNITWSTVGTVANVKLTYSTDGGASFPNTISASTTNTGSFGWTIPDAIGTTLRIKVEDVLDVDAKDESDANFKIKGSVTVTAPNGGEIWDVGSAQNITWTKTGTIANVKIEYSIDGGTNYPGGGQIIVAAQNAGALTYAWTIPDQIYTTMRVRLTDVTDATVLDQSNANFTIRGAFTLTAPNGAEKWKVGTNQNITWTTFGTIPNVRLEYSTDGGSTFPNTIIASTANASTYSWTIPNAISTTARVRVLNAADTGTLDTSNANFKIMANFTVTAPDGGEVLSVGNSYSIAWTNQGTVSNVELKYSTNSGSTYPSTIVASASNTGSYNWAVPDAISSTLRIRVADATDATDAFDASNTDFKIRAGFTVTAPNGSEAWTVASSRNITWTTAGTVANVKLEYSTNSGSTFPNAIVASVANTGTYAWTIPDAITTAARVRVSDVNDSTANDASNADFKIQGILTITAPNGGEKWTVATIQTITWDRQGSIPNVKLDFSTNGGTIYAPIVASASNTGSYAWTIPDNVSTNCLVKITDTNDSTVTDVTNAAFKIQAGFVVTSPNGGEVWGIGSARSITWTTNGTVLFVKIDYSTDSGATFPFAITSSTANTGTYSWTVPDSISGTVRVKVSQTTDSEAFDTSDGNFRIRATVGLVAPNGAEVWRVGQSRNITWTVSGTIPNVKLQYSRDGFNVDIQNINTAAPQTGSYAWTIPDSISNTVRVRMSDPNDIGAFDDSNADFKIIANFTVTAPNGSEQWTVASAQTITWTSAGSVTNVKLEYSTNSGGTWNAILGSTPNDGTQGWAVPDAISANARVRVSDPADATSDDMSDNDFKIKALFTLSSPNGSEVWTVQEVRAVTWTNTGTVPNVKLDYSTDGGANYTNAIAGTAANTGTYSWTVPDSISTTVRVKVGSTTDVDAFDTSDANFKIRGALVVTAPNGGQAWGIAQNNSITWTTTGTIPNVKITYSTNAGSTFPNVITASVANMNSYLWAVTDTPTTQARIRVESTLDSTVYDDSNANFSIQGNFTITSPNGGEVWAVSEVRSITWGWGGTIPNVKLTYSTNSGSTYPNVIAASAPNGAGSSGSFSYNWTIPDSIATTVRVKVEDVNDATVFDASNADFKIQAKFTVVAPNGAERWVVNETKAIQWTTNGTVANVKLEYSTDSGSVYANTIVASTANTGSYSWNIPNTQSTLTRIRVVNVADTTVTDASDANFTINLYTVTFNVKDLLSNNNLDQLTVNGTDNTNPAYTWAQSGLTSPITKGLQYGTWAITWTRVSYGDQTVNVVVDRDQTMDVFMETQVVHIWEAMTDLAYNTDTDMVTASSTLRRDGSTVTGATSCTIKFYDGSTLIKTLSSATTPDANGFYSFTWAAPTGLVGGKVYNVVTTMTIATGGTFNTPKTFNITDVKKLKDLETTVNSKLDTSLSQVNTNLQTTLNAQTSTLTGLLNTQTSTITTSLNTQTGAINTSLASFETKSDVQINALKLRADEIKSAGGDLQKSSEDLNATNAKFSGNLILPSNVLIGDKNVKIQYRALPGLVPLLTLTTLDINSKTTVVLNAVPMTASTLQADLYEYTVDKIASPPYTPGKKAGVVVEATTFKYALQPDKGSVKNIEAGSFLVESTTLSTLEGLVAGNSTSAIKEMMVSVIDAVRGVEASFAGGGSIVAALDNLNRKVDRLPAEFAKQGNKQDIVEIKDTVNEVAEQMKKFAGDSVGADLAEILGKALDESASMKEIRKKSDSVQGAVEITQQLMEQKLGGIDDPVIHAVFQ